MKPFVNFLTPLIVVIVMVFAGALVFGFGAGAFASAEHPFHSWFLEMVGGACCVLGTILFHDFYLR